MNSHHQQKKPAQRNIFFGARENQVLTPEQAQQFETKVQEKSDEHMKSVVTQKPKRKKKKKKKVKIWGNAMDKSRYLSEEKRNHSVDMVEELDIAIDEWEAVRERLIVEWDFSHWGDNWCENIRNEYKNSNSSERKMIRKKSMGMLKNVPYNAHKKIDSARPRMSDLAEKYLQDGCYEKHKNNQYEINRIQKILRGIFKEKRKKIRLLNKHSQFNKTQLIIKDILHCYSKKIAFILCKNTTLSNAMFTERTIKQLLRCKKQKQGSNAADCIDLKKEIIVFQSKKIKPKIKNEYGKLIDNPLYKNSTHCTSLGEVQAKIDDPDFDIRIVICCGNYTRINNVLEIINWFERSKARWGVANRRITEGKLEENFINIYVDEAHNKENGIPPFVEKYERMIFSEIVDKFVPITSTKNPLDKLDITNQGKNPNRYPKVRKNLKYALWKKNELEKNKFKISKEERKKSNDDHYSSIADAEHINIEEIFNAGMYSELHNQGERLGEDVIEYSEYKNVNGFSIDAFYNKLPKLLGNESLFLKYVEMLKSNIDIFHTKTKKRQKLFSAPESWENGEKMNYIHLLQSPCRKIITAEACNILKQALDENGNHLVLITLFGGYFKGNTFDTETQEWKIDVRDVGEGKELNQILYEFVEENQIKNRNMIIIGNEKQLGESITFVNYRINYVRSVITTPARYLSKEDSYQYACRCCFTDKYFIIKGDKRGLLLKPFGPEWQVKKEVVKFIIAPQNVIDNSKEYEMANDIWIENIEENGWNIDEICDSDNEDDINEQKINEQEYGQKLIPIQCTWNPMRVMKNESDKAHWEKWQKILIKKKRTVKLKAQLAQIIKETIKSKLVTVVDKNIERNVYNEHFPNQLALDKQLNISQVRVWNEESKGKTSEKRWNQHLMAVKYCEPHNNIDRKDYTAPSFCLFTCNYDANPGKNNELTFFLTQERY